MNTETKIPQSTKYQNQPTFTERYVKMHGNPYYMRVYYNGTAEFVRYDETIKKWIFLIFPAATKPNESAANQTTA